MVYFEDMELMTVEAGTNHGARRVFNKFLSVRLIKAKKDDR